MTKSSTAESLKTLKLNIIIQLLNSDDFTPCPTSKFQILVVISKNKQIIHLRHKIAKTFEKLNKELGSEIDGSFLLKSVILNSQGSMVHGEMKLSDAFETNDLIFALASHKKSHENIQEFDYRKKRSFKNSKFEKSKRAKRHHESEESEEETVLETDHLEESDSDVADSVQNISFMDLEAEEADSDDCSDIQEYINSKLKIKETKNSKKREARKRNRKAKKARRKAQEEIHSRDKSSETDGEEEADIHLKTETMQEGQEVQKPEEMDDYDYTDPFINDDLSSSESQQEQLNDSNSEGSLTEAESDSIPIPKKTKQEIIAELKKKRNPTIDDLRPSESKQESAESNVSDTIPIPKIPKEEIIADTLESSLSNSMETSVPIIEHQKSAKKRRSRSIIDESDDEDQSSNSNKNTESITADNSVPQSVTKVQIEHVAVNDNNSQIPDVNLNNDSSGEKSENEELKSSQIPEFNHSIVTKSQLNRQKKKSAVRKSFSSLSELAMSNDNPIKKVSKSVVESSSSSESSGDSESENSEGSDVPGKKSRRKSLLSSLAKDAKPMATAVKKETSIVKLTPISSPITTAITTNSNVRSARKKSLKGVPIKTNVSNLINTAKDKVGTSGSESE